MQYFSGKGKLMISWRMNFLSMNLRKHFFFFFNQRKCISRVLPLLSRHGVKTVAVLHVTCAKVWEALSLYGCQAKNGMLLAILLTQTLICSGPSKTVKEFHCQKRDEFSGSKSNSFLAFAKRRGHWDIVMEDDVI